MLFAIYMIDRPHASAVRQANAGAHREFVGQYLDTMYLGGPLLDDAGETAVGSLIIKDFPDREAATAFIAQEPYNMAGLFESVTIRAFSAVAEPS